MGARVAFQFATKIIKVHLRVRIRGAPSARRGGPDLVEELRLESRLVGGQYLRLADSLVHIALSVGFQTQAHFTTVFKRIVGNTPCRWRREQPNVALVAGTARESVR